MLIELQIFNIVQSVKNGKKTEEGRNRVLFEELAFSEFEPRIYCMKSERRNAEQNLTWTVLSATHHTLHEM